MLFNLIVSIKNLIKWNPISIKEYFILLLQNRIFIFFIIITKTSKSMKEKKNDLNTYSNSHNLNSLNKIYKSSR